MYAVIESGGKQFRVELGSQIEVDRLDVQPGQTIEFERVLLVADGDSTAVGRPVVEGARVSASVLRQGRGEKVVVFKYKPKARSRVKQGHRSELTVLRIADIAYDGRSAAQEQAVVTRERARTAEEASKAAAEKAAADQALAQKLAASAQVTAEAAPAARRTTRRTAKAEEPAQNGPTGSASEGAAVKTTSANGPAAKRIPRARKDT